MLQVCKSELQNNVASNVCVSYLRLFLKEPDHNTFSDSVCNDVSNNTRIVTGKYHRKPNINIRFLPG